MKNSTNEPFNTANSNAMLGEVEVLWLERLKKYLSDYKYD